MLVFLILSCDNNDRKDEAPEPEPEIQFVKPPVDCLGKKKTLDSLGVAQALIGKWQWKHANCGWRDPSDDYFKGVEVIFSDDGMMTLTGDGEPRTVTWSLKRNVSQYKETYSLDIKPVEVCLMGFIIHCDTYVMFSEKYIDGCDNIFKKVD